MTQTTIPTAPPETPPADPFRYGWRCVPRPTPDDPHHFEQVPLTLEDVLHPEVGNFIVHSDRHETDQMYLTAVLRAPGRVRCGDCAQRRAHCLGRS